MTEFGRVLSDLNEAGIQYVVVGGIAVIGHGVVRATQDVDVVVRRDDETAAALERLMGEWEATRPDGSPERRDRPSRGWPLHLRTRLGLVDVLAEEEAPLDLVGLLARAQTRTVEGTPAPLCGLADLVALKRRSNRPGDVEDLAKLEKAHGELPETT